MLKLVVLVLLVHSSLCDWYSSIGHMEDLIYEEMGLLNTLDSYIEAEEEKLEKIKNFASAMKNNAEEMKSNLEKYLGHPVNQYLLVKRLKSTWDAMEGMVSKNASDKFLTNLMNKRSQLPNEEDVEGTAKAIMRLQDTYNLDTHELAEGIIKESRAGRSLSADDCFNIGRTAYLDKDFYHCALWMREANDKILNGDTTSDRFDVLDHLAYCFSQQGNLKIAYELTEKMLELKPDHQRIKSNRQYYQDLLGAKKKGDDGNVITDTFAATLKRPSDHPRIPERSLYEKLCRDGGFEVPRWVQRNLKCYYWDNKGDPRLLLQPLKMEEMWDRPHLVRFYDIISDKEINSIKAMAKPRLNRATVQNPMTGVLEHAPYRVSKSAWLNDRESEMIRKISRRISAATGLSMETAEELQIANYGVGGQYEPHYDFARNREKGSFEEQVGNRIATMLFYLTDVEQGGSTVFLVPKIAVRPIKGSAVFWYNLYPSGAGDMRTRHAACPVLTGVKWVANKWIHERTQEFRRSCGVDENAENRIF